MDFRKQLHRSVELEAHDKLEKVIEKWLTSHCSEVSWNHLIEVLREIGFIATAKKISNELATDLDEYDGI